MLLTDEVAGPVDEAIADNDGMFERHKPADEAWNHYFRCGRSALRVIRLALAAAGKADVRKVLDLPCGHGRVLLWDLTRPPGGRAEEAKGRGGASPVGGSGKRAGEAAPGRARP